MKKLTNLREDYAILAAFGIIVFIVVTASSFTPKLDAEVDPTWSDHGKVMYAAHAKMNLRCPYGSSKYPYDLR